jgi:serine/threonine protein kinase
MLTDFPYGFEVDIWAIGIILYALLVGRMPFYADDLPGIYSNIYEGVFSFPEDLIISDIAKDLILSILNPNPRKFIYDFFKDLLILFRRKVEFGSNSEASFS